MTIYKRTGFLPFLKVGQSSDWQLKGYYKNALLSLKKVPCDVLVGFQTPSILAGEYIAPATMILRKLKIIDDEVIVINYQTVTSALFKYNTSINGVDHSYYYRNQGIFSANPNDYLITGCIYDIYIIDSQNNKFISEPFLAITDIISSVTKPIYKRTGFLPFYKSDQKTDWQIEGYWYNWALSLKKVSKNSLVSFRTPLIFDSYSAPVIMTIRHLNILGDTVSVIDSQDVPSDLIKNYQNISGIIYNYYYRQQSSMDIVLTKGCIYDIYITDGINEFVSDIFLAIDESDKEYYLITEDNQYILTENDQQIEL